MPFEPGTSGNPGGRPKVVAEVRDLARQHTTDAVGTLVSICTDKDEPAAARVSAANAILDRGYGKAPQSMELTGKDGEPLDKEVNIIDVARRFAFVIEEAARIQKQEKD